MKHIDLIVDKNVLNNEKLMNHVNLMHKIMDKDLNLMLNNLIEKIILKEIHQIIDELENLMYKMNSFNLNLFSNIY